MNHNLKEYKITTGHAQFSERLTMGGTVTMRDEVDRATLEKAVNLSAARLPFMAAELISREGAFFLRPNGKPSVVAAGPRPHPLGSAEANAHEISYSCQGNRIHFLYNHMLCDGHGFARINDTVVRNYCRLHYGLALAGGAVNMDEPPSDEDYADPYAYARLPQPPIPDVSIPRPFMPPAEDCRTDGSALLQRIRLPKDAFMGRTKELEGSPAALAALLLCRAFDEVYPTHREPFVISTPVDVRAALGCPKTAQNCLDVSFFFYPQRMKSMPLPLQMTCFRGMLLRQTDPDYLHQKMARQKEFYEQRVRLCREGKTPTETIADDCSLLLTYVGNVALGELDQYRRALTMDGLVIGNNALGMSEKSGVFHLDLTLTLKNDAVISAFLRQLEQAGLPYEADPTEILKP